MKGSIKYEKDRESYVVWWYVPEKKRSIPLRYYYDIKLYNEEMAKKLLALIQGEWERAKRNECVFRIENFQKGAGIDVLELLALWLQTKNKMKKGGKDSYKSRVNNWINPFFQDNQIALHEINLAVLAKFKLSMEKTGKEPRGVLSIMGVMSSFLDFAWRSGYIPTVPPFPKTKDYGIKDKEIPTIPRKTQFEVINLMPERHRVLFLWLILHPGRRPGEAAALHKIDYNRFKKTFTIRRTVSGGELSDSTKNKTEHEIACHPSFEQFMEDLLETDGPYLFRNSNPNAWKEGKPYRSSSMNALWNKACAEYGVDISLYNGTKHSTLDYYHNELGVHRSDLMDLTGHKTLDCLKRYVRMKVKRQLSLLELEDNAQHLQLIQGGKKPNSHQIVTKIEKDASNLQ